MSNRKIIQKIYLSLLATTFFLPANMVLAENVQLDPIVVDGSKRDIKLNKVDGAVSVVGVEELSSANVTQSEELEKIFPELVSRNRSTKIYSLFGLRGASSNDFYNPAVALYVDGVPQDQVYLTQDISDAQAVEVLKGPQGTLYGRGALGGVINIITKKPGNEWETHLSAYADNRGFGGALQTGGAIINDTLFMQISGAKYQKHGFLDNQNSPLNPFVGQSDVNELDAYNGRMKLIYDPTNSPFDAALSVAFDKLDSNEEYYVPFDDFKKDNIAVSGFEYAKSALDRTVKSYALNAGYDFGAVELRSITSYQEREMNRVIGTFNVVTPEDQDTFTQELRLATPGNNKWLDGVVGLFYQHVDFERRYGGTYLGALAAYNNYYGPAKAQHDVDSSAVFGEATLHITPDIDLTGGVRYSKEEAEMQYDRTALYGFPLAFKGKSSFDNVSFKASVGYQLSADDRIYALFSQGFKSGGFNRVVTSVAANTAFDNETSDNFEIGLRGKTADGKLSYSAAVYYTKSYDLQAAIYSGAIQILDNIGDAETKGMEFLITARPTDNWRFDLAGSFIRTEITKSSAPAPNPDITDNHIPYVPESHIVASAEYRLQLEGIMGTFVPRVAINYTGDMWFDPNNSLKQDAFTTFDASLAWEVNETVTAKLYAENITDVRYRTYGFEVAGFGKFAQVNEGFRGGVHLDVKF